MMGKSDQSLALLPRPGAIMSARGRVYTNQCWAILLRGDHEGCDPQFRVYGHRFQEKFCDNCRLHGVLVPASRLRAMPCSNGGLALNSPGEGLYADGGILNLSTGGYRMINHTKGCHPPQLVLLELEGTETVGIDWSPLPPTWIEGGSNVRLWLSRGTLVPTRPRTAYKPGAPKTGCKRAEMQTAASTSRDAKLPKPGAAALGPSHPPHQMPHQQDEQRPYVTLDEAGAALNTAPEVSLDDNDSSPLTTYRSPLPTHRFTTHHSPLTTHRITTHFCLLPTPTHHLPITTAYSPLPAHHSPLTTRRITTHHCLLTTHHCLLPTAYSPLTTAYSPLPTHHLPLTTAYCLLTSSGRGGDSSRLTTHYSLLTTHYSLLTTHYSLLTTHYSLLTTHYLLLTTHYSLLATCYLLLTTCYLLLATDY